MISRSEPLAYNVDTFCQVMSLGRTKVYDMIKSGELRSRVVGGRRLIPADEARRLLGQDQAA